MDWRNMYKKKVNWIDGSDLWILYYVIGAWSMDWRNMYKKRSKLDRWKRFMDFVSCNRSLVDGLEKNV